MGIDLRKYFVDNIHKNSYFDYKYSKLLYDNFVNEYNMFDDEEIVSVFKKLIYPYNGNYKNCKIDDEKFIYICFYLSCNKYYIEEFPNFIDKPTDRWNLSYDIIRNEILKKGGYNGIVPWSDRRLYVDSLHILKKSPNYLPDDINEAIKYISTRNAIFQEMTQDEQLKEICNCIEYFLKEKTGFSKLDYSNSCGFLNDDIVKNFRKTLECFRHASKDSIKERESYTIEQKEFMVEFGILILNCINNEKNNE